MRLDIDPNSDFSIHNLPYGIFSEADNVKKIGVAIGDFVVSITDAVRLGILSDIPLEVCETGVLNDFIGLGKEKTSALRLQLQSLLREGSGGLVEHEQLLIKDGFKMHMPVQIGDYTDFYSSIEHATNVGKLYRDPDNALLPNWRHLPVAYHGRASSIFVSGHDFHRPLGQMKPKHLDAPIFGPTKALDFELEMGFIIGKNSQPGQRISTAESSEYIFGMVLFNDWSARDIQKWEYVPLGPFLGKNFISHISPWVVTMDALEEFKVEGPEQRPEVLHYLKYEGRLNYDINLEVGLQPKDGIESVLCRSNFRYMYWNMAQQLAHHTVNGCNVKIGDLMGSGTISGTEPSSYGSMLEITKGGKEAIQLADGNSRKFVEDYDTITLRGYCERPGKRVGFGEVKARVLPSKKT